jgi:1-deoxy-D-xylulose-5-phosphate synthase
VPNLTVMQPKDEDELADMLLTGIELGSPAFIRYPRGPGMGVRMKDRPETLEIGHAEVLREGSNIVLWALGPMVKDALRIADRLQAEVNLSVGVVNARFVKPLDRTLLLSQAAVVPLIVTLEDHALAGGFGSCVLEALQEAGCTTAVERIGWPDTFVQHGSSVEELRAANGLSPDHNHRRILDRWRNLSAERIEADA